jgi:DHA1 family tetracycline resistance protein-like MFS transporter
MFAMLLVVFVDLVGFGVIIPLLPFYGHQFGASPLTVTMLLSTFSGLQLIAAPFWGRLSDRFGRKPMVLLSLVTSILAYCWLAHADALWMLFAARALQGLSAGNISVTQAYVADVTTPENRAKGMGMMGAAFGLGFIVGPAIGGFLAGGDPHHFSVVRPSYAAAGMSALALVIALVTLKESLTPEQRAAATERSGRLSLIADAFGRPRLRLLMILFFTTTCAFAGMETTFGLWALERFGWGPRQVSTIFVWVGILLVLVQGGLVRQVSKRLGGPRMLLCGTIAIGVGLALLAASFTVTLGVIACSLLSIGMGFSQPATSSLVSLEAGAMEQGGILGVNQSVGSLARIIGPGIAGLAFDWGGPSAPYVLGALAMALSCVFALRVVRQHRAAAGVPSAQRA